MSGVRLVLGLVVAAALGVGVAALLRSGDDGRPVAVPATATPLAELRVAPEVAAAQLMLVGFAGTAGASPGVARLAERDWGGVVVTRSNAAGGPAGVRALVSAIRARAEREGRVAPLVAIRQAGGETSALPTLPPVPQADQAVPREAAREAGAAARALRPLGVDLVLAPVADLAAAAGPAADTGFGEDPEKVADLVGAAVATYRAEGIASAPGSFPGQGGASRDPAEGPATVGLDLPTLRSDDMAPFVAAARAGAPAMQLSVATYVAWDGVTPASLAPEAYDLLRRGARFGGVAITGDLNAATAVGGGTVADTAVAALRAGADLLFVPGAQADQERAHRALANALRSDAVLRGRAAEALARISRLRSVTNS